MGSDVETWLAPEKVSTIKVDDTNGDFHFAKRKKTGTWINSNIFIAAWKAIKEEGVWSSKDWTVKVDADAVFLPIRLRDYLGKVEVTDAGIYLENCATTMTPAIHHFKTPKAYFECLK